MRTLASRSSCAHWIAAAAVGSVHHNRYDLRTGVISTFEVELRDDTMYLLWNKKKNEAQPHKFAFEVPVELRGAQERIATLESELVALGRAAEIREQDTKSTVRQMGSMLLEVEQKSEALSRVNLSLVAANEFIYRVTNAMREVLIVLDPQGHVTDVEVGRAPEPAVHPLEVARLATERRSGIAAEEQDEGAAARGVEPDAAAGAEAREAQGGHAP